MRKIILIIIIFILALFVYVNVNAEVDDIVIPDAAIRVRVIANSDSFVDQSMKYRVKEYIEKNISNKLIDVNNIDDARDIISLSLNDLDIGIRDIFSEYDYDMDYSINFGDNYFPSKDYKGVHYDSGNYESLVVVIGEGNGNNWWCVLFPPLCLLEASDSSDVEYQFFVQKLLNKVFS